MDSVNEEVIIRLKWGQTEYKGRLVSIDSYMNIQLSGAEEWIDQQMTSALGQVLIRYVCTYLFGFSLCAWRFEVVKETATPASEYSANVLQMQQCTVDSRRKSKQRECRYKDGGMISRCLGVEVETELKYCIGSCSQAG
jgi:small nuclear ribonucleoprotein (snRNP)-like protein